MERQVCPELLDSLPADDRRAIQSRRDLRKVNWWMGHAGTISRLLAEAALKDSPKSLVELGAGDGTLLLRIAQRLAPKWRSVRAVLVDRQRLLSTQTISSFESLGWTVEAVQMDALDWFERSSALANPARYDICLANLFLHHLQETELKRLLRLAAGQADLFLACEPRRAGFTLGATQLLRLLGCNHVSLADGKTSVRAGFDGQELSGLWPEGSRNAPQERWQLLERRIGLFSHCFLAQRANG